jgi:hypothetical protein
LTAQCLGDGHKRQIVIRWPKPAASEKQIGAPRERRADFISDGLGLVTHDSNVAHAPAHPAHDPAQVIRVRVLHQAKQHFIADDDNLDVDHAAIIQQGPGIGSQRPVKKFRGNKARDTRRS